MHLFKALYLKKKKKKKKKRSSYVSSCLLKRYGPNLQNDTKLDTTSCFIAEKMALDEPLFCTGSLYGKRFSGVNPKTSNLLCECPAILH